MKIDNGKIVEAAKYGGGEVPNKMRKLADRIEAAWNRRTK